VAKWTVLSAVRASVESVLEYGTDAGSYYSELSLIGTVVKASPENSVSVVT
jgi:hypothetical protein